MQYEASFGPPLRLSVLGLAVAAVVAGSAPSAQATPPGKPGPIAFQRAIDPQDEESTQIFTVARPGAKPRKLTSGGSAVNADYSPDGERIVFERRYGGKSPDSLFTMGSDGSSQSRLPTACTAPTCLGDSAPAWSPDGNRLVFERAFGPIVKDSAAGLDLVTANADGSNEQVILHYRSLEAQGQEPHDAQWSPDGTRIAVMILNTKAKPRNASAIYVLNADGSGLHRVTPVRLNAGNADWSPNGKRIAFNSFYGGPKPPEIYTVRPNGTGLHRVRREPKNSYSFDPVWSPGGGRLAFVHGAGPKPPHIWTMRKNGTALRQVTRGRLPDFGPDWGSK
jgi:TolB protein